MQDLYVLSRGIDVGLMTKSGKKLQLIAPHGVNAGNSEFLIQKGQTIHDAVEQRYGIFNSGTDFSKKFRLRKRTLCRGEYYPRIFGLPILLPHSTELPISYEQKMFETSTRAQLSLLLERFRKIANTVQPTKQSLNVSGMAIRELLILACTEVEAQFKWIMEPHCKSSKRPKNMENFHKSAGFLKLVNYEVNFLQYPNLKPFRPFKNWSQKKYTPLNWYQAYNDTKHNRLLNLNKATMENAMCAISALAVLLARQVGCGSVCGDGPGAWPDPMIIASISVCKKWQPEISWSNVFISPEPSLSWKTVNAKLF